MNTTFYALAALAASLLGNLLLLRLFCTLRREAAHLRAEVQNLCGEYMRLWNRSHRRDPKTGRLLPKGK